MDNEDRKKYQNYKRFFESLNKSTKKTRRAIKVSIDEKK